MASGIDSGSDPGSQDPYSRLSITPDASFEAVQQARERALAAAGEDPQDRARVESAYDAVLMERLRERQSGRVSSAAATASQREQQIEASGTAEPRGPGVLLTRFRQLNLPTPGGSGGSWLPTLTLVQGQGLLVRGLVGGLGVLLLLLSAGSAELMLALGTIGLFLSQIRRGCRPLASLGWSVLLLASGLVLGSVVQALISGAGVSLPLTAEQMQSLPALLLLLAGALFLG